MLAYHDALETRDPAAREAALLAALPDVIARAQRAGGFWAAQLAGRPRSRRALRWRACRCCASTN